MFLRRSAADGFFRIYRYYSQTFSSAIRRAPTNSQSNPGKLRSSCQFEFGDHTWKTQHWDRLLQTSLCAQAALIVGINVNIVWAEDISSESNYENNTLEGNATGLRRIEDGSVISNTHTSKWRIFTDKGRECFFQGKLHEAENFFQSALQEAKEGFGERDPHVASSCNNLAELYRVKKAFDKAEPLYLEAVKILEESYGLEDIRVGAALHNLGQFYLMQRKLEDAHISYERALKIKRRVLGHNHVDYADTMYHLGMVLYLQGKEKDSEALIQDSIKIMEEGGSGESPICIKRLRQLAQMYIKSNRLAEAENVQRKILHIMELEKGWNYLGTVLAAEELALTLQPLGSLSEAQELLNRCLDARKSLLPKDHIQIAANMLHIARVKQLIFSQLRKTNISEATSELNKVEELLDTSIRIAQQNLHKPVVKDKQKHGRVSRETGKDGNTALIILLQSLNTLAQIEATKQELQESREHHKIGEAENALRRCISAFKEFGTERSMSNNKAKAEYLSCMKHLLNLTYDGSREQESRKATVQELKDEIKRVELELSPKGKHGK